MRQIVDMFAVPIHANAQWQVAERQLLDAAATVCQPFFEEARKHIAKLTTKEGLDTPSVDPRITMALPDPDRINLVVRVPASARRKGRVE